jgi:protein SCO1/2
MKRLVATSAFAAFLLLPAAAPAQMGPVPPPPLQATPGILQEVGWDQKLGGALPLDAAFVDEAGHEVKLGDYFGKKPVVISLVYYRCPMLCTLSLNGLAGALEVLSFVPGQEFEVITVSFDPREGPVLAAAKKKAYMARYKRSEAERGWHFLTGQKDSIDALTRAVGFRYVWDADTKQYAHPAGMLVATPEGRISRYLFGVEYSPKDLRLALVDAAGGKIGSTVDQLLLLCYQYDPKTGRYSASILRWLRLAAIATVVALFGFIFTASMKRHGRGDGPAPSGRGTEPGNR